MIHNGLIAAAGNRGDSGILLQDSFTDTEGTLLTAHTPEIGNAWINHFGSMKIASNKAVHNASGVGTSNPCVVKSDVGTKNWYAELVINGNTAQSAIISPLAGENWVILYVAYTGIGAAIPQIYTSVNGSYTLQAAGDAVSSPYNMKAQAYENKYRLQVNDTTIIEWDDLAKTYNGTDVALMTFLGRVGQFDDLVVIPSDGTQL